MTVEKWHKSLICGWDDSNIGWITGLSISQIIFETQQNFAVHHESGELCVGVIGGTNDLSTKETKTVVQLAGSLGVLSVSLTNIVEHVDRGGNEFRLGRFLWTVGVQLGFEGEKGAIKISIRRERGFNHLPNDLANRIWQIVFGKSDLANRIWQIGFGNFFYEGTLRFSGPGGGTGRSKCKHRFSYKTRPARGIIGQCLMP
jgi:hypothetical protein